MTILYRKDHNGKIRFKEIIADGDELIRRHGVLNGKVSEKIDIINGNTLRDGEEQAIARMDSAIKKMLQEGFKYTIDEAKEADKSVNALGFLKPMKAIVYNRNNMIVNINNCVIQRKYNGHRCMITKQNGELFAYSRGGKLINTIPEILSGIEMPDGVTIDGELYAHGYSLQTISSWARRKQPNTDRIQFVAYDLVSSDTFSKRFDFLRSFNLGDRVEIAEGLRYRGDLDDVLYREIGNGYEGLILRPEGYGYEHRRSKHLLKVKTRFDDEFLVVDINPSRDGWAILTCATKDGKRFNASAPGNVNEKTLVLQNKKDYIGRYVNVKYPELTDSGIPAQPVACYWRNKFGE